MPGDEEYHSLSSSSDPLAKISLVLESGIILGIIKTVREAKSIAQDWAEAEALNSSPTTS